MWILETLKQSWIILIFVLFRKCHFSNYIFVFDYRTLYTTIPHENLKTHLKQIIHKAFYFKNGSQRYKCLVLVMELTYFLKHETKGEECFTEYEVISHHSYKAEFIQKLNQRQKLQKLQPLNLSFRYIDDVLSINNPDFANCISVIYPKELEIKDPTKAYTEAKSLILHSGILMFCQLII